MPDDPSNPQSNPPSGPPSNPSNPSHPSGPGRSGRSGRSGSSRRRGTAKAGEYACVFWLSGARYALDAVLVGEVVSVPSLLPVPVTPAWLLGLCNLRGVALAVVDLAAVLGMRTAAPAAPSAGGVPVLVLRAHGVTVGIRIDRIEAVYPFDAARLTPSTAIDEHPAVKGLLGFEARGGFVATLLDEQKVAARLKELKFKKAEAGAA
jgi:chemotaxis signal transduction protein